MEIKSAYNHWSSSYDEDVNLTRDLDFEVMIKTFKSTKLNSILEIGCGTGKNTELLSRIARKVYAFDFSLEMISKAKEKIKSENVFFAVADMTKRWQTQDELFNLITCNLVLEHIENINFIFSEAYRSLVVNGKFYISELHPFRQYEGTKANFERDGIKTEIQAFVHHISDFLNTANKNGFKLLELKELWHERDQNKPPRLVTFMFEKIL
jgi:ubiquinone/menaquinone biosynthesis C-methylase UbiE